MGKLVGSKKRMIVFRTIAVLCFFTALIGTVVLVEGLNGTEEDAEVMAARRSR